MIVIADPTIGRLAPINHIDNRIRSNNDEFGSCAQTLREIGKMGNFGCFRKAKVERDQMKIIAPTQLKYMDS
jgi:hypothetical protein